MPPDGNPRPRKAVPGELCPCGRQARLVYLNPNGSEVGYCGLPDRGIDKTVPCPFCGGAWPEYGICSLYEIRPLVTPAATVQKGNDQDDDEDERLNESEEGGEQP